MVARPSIMHVEDDPIWSDLTAKVLRGFPTVHYLGTARTCAEGLALCAAQQPSLVLLDLFLPDGDGLILASEFAKFDAPPRLLVLSSRYDEAMLARLETRPVSGFIWKEIGFQDHLGRALTALMRGDCYFQSEVVEEIRRFRRAPDCFAKILSNRELSLLDNFGRGESDETIAAMVALSPNTIHSHRTNIITKMGLSGTVALIQWAQSKGFGVVRRRRAPFQAVASTADFHLGR